MEFSVDREKMLERFVSYCRIDTQSDENSSTTPSTEKQRDLSRKLTDELKALGLESEMDEWGYVYATLPENLPAGDARAGRVLEALRRHRGAREVARQDGADPRTRQPLSQPLGLRDAALRERSVRRLDDPRRIARCFAVPDDEDRHLRVRNAGCRLRSVRRSR